jgi:hypothetical protein
MQQLIIPPVAAPIAFAKKPSYIVRFTTLNKTKLKPISTQDAICDEIEAFKKRNIPLPFFLSFFADSSIY